MSDTKVHLLDGGTLVIDGYHAFWNRGPGALKQMADAAREAGLALAEAAIVNASRECASRRAWRPMPPAR